MRPDRAITSYWRQFAAPAYDASSCGAAGTMRPNSVAVCTLPNIGFAPALALWRRHGRVRAPSLAACPRGATGGPAQVMTSHPHHGNALAQLGKPDQFRFPFHQMDGGLALAAVANAWIVTHRFQRLPALRALPIQMAALNGYLHMAPDRRIANQAEASMSAGRQVRTRWMS